MVVGVVALLCQLTEEEEQEEEQEEGHHWQVVEAGGLRLHGTTQQVAAAT